MNKICWFIGNGNKKFPHTTLTEKIEISIYRHDWAKTSEWWGKFGLVNRDHRLTQGRCICLVAFVQGFGCGLYWLVLGQRQRCLGRWQQSDSTRPEVVGDLHPCRPPQLAWTWPQATCYSCDVGPVGSRVGPETYSLSLAVMLWPKKCCCDRSMPPPSLLPILPSRLGGPEPQLWDSGTGT